MATAAACILAQTGSQAAARGCSTASALNRPTGSSRPSPPPGEVRGQPRLGAERAMGWPKEAEARSTAGNGR
eukprot:10040022-Alexandrium_andersonii.AAC.1